MKKNNHAQGPGRPGNRPASSAGSRRRPDGTTGGSHRKERRNPTGDGPEAKAPFWAPFAKKATDNAGPRDRRRPAQESHPASPDRPNRRPDRPPFSESRPDRRERPDRPDRRERPERPDRRERPDRPPFSESRPDRRERHDRHERPDRRERPERPASSAAQSVYPIRLNKYIAHCGICARRQAAEFVKAGTVTVNDKPETNPGYLVQAGETVRFKGKVVRPEEKKVYILMNKPKGVITTASDEKGRKTVLDIVGPKVQERVFPVGRLDRMTTGLLLLTNDGDLATKLAHPKHKVKKVYHVTLDKPLTKADLERISAGIPLEDGPAVVDAIGYVDGKKDEIGIELHSGKNRIIRRIFEQLGYEVVRLDRTYYAGLTKKDIGRGHFRHLTEKEIILLRHFT